VTCVCVCFVTKGPVNPDHSDLPFSASTCVFRYKGACYSVCVYLRTCFVTKGVCVCCLLQEAPSIRDLSCRPLCVCVFQEEEGVTRGTHATCVCFVTKGPVNPDHKLSTSDSRGQR
jgi:hypothetical protein